MYLGVYEIYQPAPMIVGCNFRNLRPYLLVRMSQFVLGFASRSRGGVRLSLLAIKQHRPLLARQSSPHPLINAAGLYPGAVFIQGRAGRSPPALVPRPSPCSCTPDGNRHLLVAAARNTYTRAYSATPGRFPQQATSIQRRQ